MMTDAAVSIFGKSPPPVASDKLFEGDSTDWDLNACISHWGETGYAYKAGFRKAAFDIVVKVCAEPVDQDLVIYPIVYLYRHHIELVLKDTIRLALEFLGQSLTDGQQRKLGRHDLSALWNILWPMLAPVCKMAGVDPLPEKDIKGIDAYFRQINAHDHDGQSFRYARTREHKRTLGPELRLINIRSFAINMEKLADYLEGIERWLALMIDGRDEGSQQ